MRIFDKLLFCSLFVLSTAYRYDARRSIQDGLVARSDDLLYPQGLVSKSRGIPEPQTSLEKRALHCPVCNNPNTIGHLVDGRRCGPCWTKETRAFYAAAKKERESKAMELRAHALVSKKVLQQDLQTQIQQRGEELEKHLKFIEENFGPNLPHGSNLYKCRECNATYMGSSTRLMQFRLCFVHFRDEAAAMDLCRCCGKVSLKTTGTEVIRRTECEVCTTNTKLSTKVAQAGQSSNKQPASSLHEQSKSANSNNEAAGPDQSSGQSSNQQSESSLHKQPRWKVGNAPILRSPSPEPPNKRRRRYR